MRGTQTGVDPLPTRWRRAPAVLILALVSALGCGGALVDRSCTSEDTWVVQGLQYGHFAESGADELLTGSIRVGEIVRLRVTTHRTSGCDDAVAGVVWHSTSPEVATLTPIGRLDADLLGVRPGETTVSADVTLGDGSRATAELRGNPSEGSPLLRVYAVRVTP